MKHTGFTLWLTGLSGSGKTTIAQGVAEWLRTQSLPVEVLDGDIVRNYLSQELGFSKEDRDRNIRRIAFVARLLSRHQVIVIVSAISPYQKTREEARKMLENFVEVYVKASLDVCEKRDVKGLYAKARSRKIEQFTGIDHPYEEPINPEIICHTDHETVEESINKVISLLQQKQYLPHVMN